MSLVRALSTASRALALAGLCSLWAAPAVAQQDEEGCKDHPMFSRMPNFSIGACEEQEFSTHEFELADGYKTVEGHYWRIDFALNEGAKTPGPLQIGRNYWNPIAAKGAAKLLEQFDSGGGQLTARIPGTAGAGNIWLGIGVANGGDLYTLWVVQEAGMRQDVAFTASELADALAKTGSVTLNNILFDTGKATIRPESEAPLRAVIDLMKGNSALRLEIQGHTDNVGAKDANLALSRDRAESVKAYLVKGGLDAARLTTAGLGDTQPVADNTTEAGRAQNRRVVLVRK
jgi:OmpA-OmpF porin, OOP family